MSNSGFLIRNRGQKQKAHIWRGNDTVCRMWSTGGLKRKNFAICDSPQGHEICHMCALLMEHRAA